MAPPNFAPRKSVRTMWDLMRDVAVKAGWLAAPSRPSFSRDILPVFQRLAGLQWVNAGFAAGFGWEGAIDLTSPSAIARLGAPAPPTRISGEASPTPFAGSTSILVAQALAWLYGDAMNIPPPETPRQNAALGDLRLAMLAQWAAGDFRSRPHPYVQSARMIRKLTDDIKQMRG